MKIEIDDNDFIYMMHLIFMGIEVVNINLNPQPLTAERLKYNEIFEDLLTQYASFKEGEQLSYLSDELFDKYNIIIEKICDVYLKKYNETNIIDYLSNFLADKYYPDSKVNRPMRRRHSCAVDEYYDLLFKHKIKNIDIIAPTIETKLNARLQKYYPE